jgi:hypothetical protein
MADQSLEILIKIQSELAQLQQTVQGLNEAKQATQRGTEANKEHGKSFVQLAEHSRGFHRLLHSITEESPVMGLALHAAFSGPGAAIAGLILLLHQMKSADKESEKAANEAAESASEGFIDIGKAIEKSVDHIHDAKIAHDEWVKSLTAQTKEVETALNKEIEKLHAVADAVKEINKAQGKSNAEVSFVESHAEISLIQGAIDKLNKQLSEASRDESNSSAAAMVGRNERVAKLELEVEAAKKETEKDKKSLTEAEEKLREGDVFKFSDVGKRISASLGFADQINKPEDDPRYKRVEQLENDRSGASYRLGLSTRDEKKYSDELAREKAAQDVLEKRNKEDQKRVSDLVDQLKTLNQKLESLSTKTSIREMGVAMSGGGGDAISAVVARGSASLSGHLTGLEGVAANKELARMLSALNENNKAMVDTIRAGFNDVEGLAKIVVQLKSEQAKLRAQIKSTNAP